MQKFGARGQLEVGFSHFGGRPICADEIRRRSAGQLVGRAPYEVQHPHPIGGCGRERQGLYDSLCPRGRKRAALDPI